VTDPSRQQPPATSYGHSPGWFPDPIGRHEHRYFNGVTWTADVADRGNRSIDPLGTTNVSPPARTEGNRIATAAMTCGLVGGFLAWIPLVVAIGFVLGVLALVFGIKGLRRSRLVGTGRGFAITGIVSGAVALALSVVGIVWSVKVLTEVIDFIEPGPVTAEITSCEMTESAIVVRGELINLSDERRDYTVYGWVTSPFNEQHSDMISELSAVPPNQPVPFTLQRLRAGEAGSCEAEVDVQGPAPYGLEFDRIED
jgi:hypothetical protein